MQAEKFKACPQNFIRQTPQPLQIISEHLLHQAAKIRMALRQPHSKAVRATGSHLRIQLQPRTTSKQEGVGQTRLHLHIEFAIVTCRAYLPLLCSPRSSQWILQRRFLVPAISFLGFARSFNWFPIRRNQARVDPGVPREEIRGTPGIRFGWIARQPAYARHDKTLASFRSEATGLNFAGFCEGLGPNPEDLVHWQDRYKPVAD